MDFARGDTITKLKVLAQAARRRRRGTTVWFKPDHDDLHRARATTTTTLASRLRELSFLNKGVTITLTDERAGPGEGRDVPRQGRAQGVRRSTSTRTRKALHTDVVYIETERDDIGDRARAAVQRRLQRERLLLRQQHQHARGRHAPHRLQVGAHARDQRLRDEGQLPQEGQLHAVRRRRARRADGGALGQGARAAVRGADEDEARQLGSRGRGEDRGQRVARGVSRGASARRRTSSSRRRCRRRARARRRARRAISRARSRRSTSAICRASSPTAR